MVVFRGMHLRFPLGFNPEYYRGVGYKKTLLSVFLFLNKKLFLEEFLLF